MTAGKLCEMLIVVVLLASFSASAAERHWAGGTFGSWTNKACWAENAVPTRSDTVIFDTNGDVYVRTASSDSNLYCAGIRVESGNVSFSSGRTLGFQKGYCGGTGVVYVAEGSTLCVTNSWGGGNKDTPSSRACLRKEGKGVFKTTNNLGYSDASGSWPFPTIEITEGSIEMLTEGKSIRSPRTIVRKDASLILRGYNCFYKDNTGIVQVDEGGLLDIKAFGTQTVGGFEGAGRITGVSDGVNLTMRMAEEDCEFSGTIETISVTIPNTATKQFVVASSNALASVGAFATSGSALQFAPGIGEFWVKNLSGASSGYGVIPTEDMAGKPVVVHASMSKCSYIMSASGAGELAVNNTWDRSGGTFTIGTNTTMQGERTTAMNSNQTEFTRPRSQGLSANFSGTAAVVDVNGGKLAVGHTGSGWKSQLNTMKIRNGGSLTAFVNPTAKSDKSIYIDGGALNYSFALANALDFGSDSYPWKVKVGAAGATFGVDYVPSYASGRKLGLYMAADTDPDAATDGGATYDLPVIVNVNRAQNLKGPLALLSGTWAVNADAYKDGAGTAVDTPLGQGDLELGTVRLALNAKDATRVTPLAGGPGAKLTLSGATRMTLKYDSSYVAQAAVIGPEGGSGCPISSKNGGVLFLRALNDSFDGSIGDASASGQVKVNGTVPVDAAGRVTLPVFAQSGSTIDFSAYDAEKGFVAFADYTAFAESEASNVALVNFETDASITISEDKAVAALKIAADASGDKAFNIASGKTLSIGSGAADAPALVILKPAGQWGNASISGPGTLDFGARQAVFAVGRGTSYAHAPHIGAKISTTGGVAYATPILDTVYPWVATGGSNDYEGGTFINGIQVRPESNSAFGCGVVRVGDGELDGGQVCFAAARNITNAFSIAGNGVKWATMSPDRGALWFCAAATLTGPVEIRRRARISACKGDYIANGGQGTFKGVVSGGALQLMKSTFPIVFEAANTYTGGTEIVSSTLVLKGAGTAGTGTVTLDNGVLRFENTESITFTNKVDGVGTIEVAGTASVTFTDDSFKALRFKTLAPGSTVDYPACDDATCVVGGTGFDIDLGGEDVTVAGVSGSGTIRGGVMTVTGEINPGGSNAVGTVTFETAPVLTGVTLVAETEGGDVDKVVLAGDADVSTMNLRIVQIGEIVPFSPSAILSCGGTLTGEFASDERPARKSMNYEVGYEAAAATLSYARPGGVLLVR